MTNDDDELTFEALATDVVAVGRARYRIQHGDRELAAVLDRVQGAYAQLANAPDAASETAETGRAGQ